MGRIEDCFIFQLGKAYQQVNHEAKRRLAPYGVTPVQYALLDVLWEADGQSGAALGERLRLDGATITGLLDRLAHAGFVVSSQKLRGRYTGAIEAACHGVGQGCWTTWI